ncbi:N amino acid transport system protein, partial [Teratosphaeria destructans]
VDGWTVEEKACLYLDVCGSVGLEALERSCGIGLEAQVKRTFEDTGSKMEEDHKSSMTDGHDNTIGLRNDLEKQRVSNDPYPHGRRQSKHEGKADPFGDEEGAEVQYRTMTWWQAAMIMVAETISLGILSLPSVLASIGIVPGVILIAGLGLIATYTGYIFYQFKLEYPFVHNMADVGEVLLGAWGREILGAAQTIFLVFTMGSHVLTFTIALNAISQHATCTIVWSVVGLVLFLIFSLPRTLKKVSYLSIASFISIFAAVIITMIGVGIEQPDPVVQATVTVEFASAFASVTNIIFAYAGHVAFFSFISELRDPRDFPKALFFLQTCDIILYLVVAVVVYRYTGPDVASPALGSTGTTVKRVAYGIALPTIIIAGIIYAHVAAKYIYVRIFRGTRHMSKKTFLSVGSWLGIVLTLWIIAWVIAESIPVFNDLLGLISSLFASWFTYGLAGILWLYLNHGQWFSNGRKSALTVANLLILAMGAAICGIGLYATGTAIHDDAGSGSNPADFTPILSSPPQRLPYTTSDHNHQCQHERSRPASRRAAGQEDYVDKGLDAVEKKVGTSTGHEVDPNKMRSTNEKITDKARGMFEKATGKSVPEKMSN